MIRNIARNELKNLFYSPLAWFVVIVFLTQCAFYFVDKLFIQSVQTDLLITLQKNPPKSLLTAATEKVFGGGNGILGEAAKTLFLFVPLLTMGIINREINNGSIQLLYSSPVKPFQIVIGKYLGMMVFNVLLVLTLLFFVCIGFFVIDNVEYATLLSGVLGIFLLLCASSAIGLFMSSITNYPIVAALGTFLILLGLGYIGGFLQQYDILRDITWSLSLNDRLQKMLWGLIRSKDVLLYLNITAAFIILTIFQLEQIRNRNSFSIRFGRSAVVVIAFGLFQYIVSKPQFVKYWDVTATKGYTLTAEVQDILVQMKDAPLEVTLYGNLLGDDAFSRSLPSKRNKYLEDVWDKYIRFKPDMEFKYEYFYDNSTTIDRANLGRAKSFPNFPGKNIHEVAKEMAKLHKLDFSMFKTPEEMRKQIDLEPEGYHTVILLTYKNRSEFLRTSLTTGSDVLIASALKRLIASQPPSIGYVTGELERDIYQLGKREYAEHTGRKLSSKSILNLGFHVDTINLTTQHIPDSLTALVIADPRREFSEVALAKLKKYLQEGRNMFVLAEPDKREIINPLLMELGVEMLPGIIVQPRKEESPDNVQVYPFEGFWQMAEEVVDKANRNNTYHQFLLHKAGALKVVDNKYDVEPLFRNISGTSWLDLGHFVADSLPPVFNADEGDQYGDFNMGLLLTREVGGKQQRVAVISDADLLSNEALRKLGHFSPQDIPSWLHYGEFPVKRRVHNPQDIISIKPKSVKLLKPLLIIGLPVLTLLMAFAILQRRSKK